MGRSLDTSEAARGGSDSLKNRACPGCLSKVKNVFRASELFSHTTFIFEEVSLYGEISYVRNKSSSGERRVVTRINCKKRFGTLVVEENKGEIICTCLIWGME